MDAVLTLFNQTITVADIAAFVANWILPAVSGVFASWVTNKYKLNIPFDIPDQIRTWIIRGFVAGICVVINVVGQWLLTESAIDAGTIPTLFSSYVTAVAAYDHLFKKK